ncbi:MAG: hypothetical protein LAP21_24220, partial [Acidobacteriia bacterium]|nr:hypothetical protein [Terriglobia bacterium]
TVSGAALGNYTNTTGNVTSTNGGTGNTASSNLTVASVPSMVVAFGVASIPLNGTTTLTFNITNPNTGTALTGIAFTDNLPAGLTVAPSPNLNNTCGGTFTSAAGAGQVALSGVTLPASASCAASVDVQGTTAGVKNNSVTVASTEGGTGITSNASVTVVSGLRFVPVAPCRIADTRNATGPFGGPFLSGQTTRGFTIPQSACGIPAAAQAYSLNVTVVPHGTLGFLTMFPCGQSLPLVSTLNSIDGRVKAAAAIVPAGTNGAVCAFPTNDTDMVLDINGYFVPATDASALDFYPVTPCRLVDTRLPSGPLGGPSLVGNSTRTFPLLSSSCNIPSGAKAYSLNYTSVPRGPFGFLTTWPSPQTQPLVSTLNAPTGAITANAAIVPAGINGDISVFVTNDSDLVIDVNGYFAPPAPGGLSLFNVAPCRVLDTRSPTPTNGQPFTSVDLNITTAGCGVPATAQSYVLNATVVPPGPLGFLTLWPQGAPKPLVSTLNAADGAVTSNMAIVPTTNGSISAFASSPTHLVLDISGYFAPSQPAGFGPAGSRTPIPAGFATAESEIPSGPATSPSGASPPNENVFSIFLNGVDPPQSFACCKILDQKATDESGPDDAQSDRESKRNAQGRFLEQLLGDRIHLLTERIQ